MMDSAEIRSEHLNKSFCLKKNERSNRYILSKYNDRSQSRNNQNQMENLVQISLISFNNEHISRDLFLPNISRVNNFYCHFRVFPLLFIEKFRSL